MPGRERQNTQPSREPQVKTLRPPLPPRVLRDESRVPSSRGGAMSRKRPRKKVGGWQQGRHTRAVHEESSNIPPNGRAHAFTSDRSVAEPRDAPAKVFARDHRHFLQSPPLFSHGTPANNAVAS